MDHLPKDPAILVSSVNMLLRDEEFDSLPQLCSAFGEDAAAVERYLASHGFRYDKEQRQFKEK